MPGDLERKMPTVSQNRQENLLAVANKARALADEFRRANGRIEGSSQSQEKGSSIGDVTCTSPPQGNIKINVKSYFIKAVKEAVLYLSRRELIKEVEEDGKDGVW
ncbi:uncharacterized protein G2W53_037457 [Senna tora]|uniref:Uncharacterized protein n=1 Tax=Senna tora TaxID=362788 RepID=A0A834W4D8_9FABA|nr:uncharacterized protein G2W53_037457 [Senna tora]